MSDMKRIIDARKAERDATVQAEWRKVAAAEQTADALEGIRQDLTALVAMLPALLQALQPRVGDTRR